MKPKLRIVDFGKSTYVELDGKVFGTHTKSVKYEKYGQEPATLEIKVDDVGGFEWLRDSAIGDAIAGVSPFDVKD